MRAEVAKKRGCSFEKFTQLMREDDAIDADLTEVGRKQVLRSLGNRYWCCCLEEAGTEVGREQVLVSDSQCFISILNFDNYGYGQTSIYVVLLHD